MVLGGLQECVGLCAAVWLRTCYQRYALPVRTSELGCAIHVRVSKILAEVIKKLFPVRILIDDSTRGMHSVAFL